MYYALYRKYRPKNLNEIIGQEIIKNSLINSLNNNKISHAYLFSGPRGTGKTSIAKILARTVNCLEQSDGICCGKCNNCIESLNNSSPDIIEIDAASNNGVDEIREIRNKVNLVPTSMKYKIYIIDEVHMLTTGAFNALLKTLEEPPSHVIFILATTDLHKVPITILSRCQVFNFKRIETSKIADHLDYICKNEKITVDYTLLEKIADYSDGCMRDSIGLLEKLISYNSNKLSVVDFENILGVVNNDIIILLINNINNNDVLGTIDLVDKVYKNGKDINFFVQDIITFLRNTIISYYLGNNIDYPIEYLLLLTNKFLEINNVLKNSNNSKIALEIGIIEFINSSSLIIKPDNIDKTVIVQRSTDIVENFDLEDKNISREIKEDIVIVNKREEKEKNSYIENNDYFISSEKYEKYKFDIINNAFATANKVVLKELKEKLKEINTYIYDMNRSSLINIFLDSDLVAAGSSDLIFMVSYDSLIDSVKRNYWLILEIIESYFNKKFNFIFITVDEWNICKNDFISNKNDGIKYEYKNLVIEKTNEVFNNNKENEEKIIEHQKDNVIDLFGEVIEFE